MNQPGFDQGALPTLPQQPPPPRSAAPVIIAAIAGLIVGGALTAIVMVLLRAPAPPPKPMASASAKPAPPPSASASAAPAALTLEQRAAKGDKDAVSQLEKLPRDQRTAAQDLALASARRVAKIKQIDDIGRKIKLVQKFGRARSTKKQIEKLAADREVGNYMLETLAKLPGPVGPDLLYSIWAHTHRRNATTELAEQLLYSKDVRPKASQALSLALELRDEKDCKKMSKLLELAEKQGDRRSVVPILKLNSKRGCGPKKISDCWACLRKTTLIKDALKAANKNRAP